MKETATNAKRRPAGKTREAILELAEALIEERGYNAFSYRDIATQLDIKNAAIHYYFKAKADLGNAVITNYRRRFANWTKETEAATEDAWQRLNAYFGVYADILGRREPNIFSNGILSAEFHTLPEKLQEQIRIMLRERYDWLIKVLRTGRERGELHYGGSPETKALEIAAATQGALQISQVVALGAERFCQVVEQIKYDVTPTSRK